MLVPVLRFVIRSPFIAMFTLCWPFFFLLDFAMGSSPREAFEVANGMWTTVAFGKF